MAETDPPQDPLAALRDGDPGPFEAFVRTHARTFFLFFRRQGAATHRAEDLTQETFLKLHQNAHRYAAQERVLAYCFRVARNVWIDDQRRLSVRPSGISIDADGRFERGLADGGGSGIREGGPGPKASHDPLEHATRDEEDARMRVAIAGLPEHHRVVFELAVLEELTYPEVADVLDIPVGTVKSRMFHAVRKLQAALEPNETGKQGGAR